MHVVHHVQCIHMVQCIMHLLDAAAVAAAFNSNSGPGLLSEWMGTETDVTQGVHEPLTGHEVGDNHTRTTPQDLPATPATCLMIII